MTIMFAGNKQSVLIVALLACACRSNGSPSVGGGPRPAGEPESYAATIVRTFEDGDRREVSESRVVRSGDLRREEWVEQGERRAFIWRPDLGKVYLLSLDRKLYGEFPMARKAPAELDEPSAGASGGEDGPRADDSAPAGAARLSVDPDAIEQAFDDAADPVKVEARALPDQLIDGHACEVFERRASFAGGQVETTRIYRARDLAGLAIRVETESNREARHVRAVTERRDINLDMSPGEFGVPDGFRRDDKLMLR